MLNNILSLVTIIFIFALIAGTSYLLGFHNGELAMSALCLGY